MHACACACMCLIHSTTDSFTHCANGHTHSRRQTRVRAMHAAISSTIDTKIAQQSVHSMPLHTRTHQLNRRMHIVQNIKRMIEKIGPKKRLSSAEFNADGEWYACSVSRLLSFQSTVIVWTQGMPKCMCLSGTLTCTPTASKSTTKRNSLNGNLANGSFPSTYTHPVARFAFCLCECVCKHRHR
jgi:hypothetical protein